MNEHYTTYMPRAVGGTQTLAGRILLKVCRHEASLFTKFGGTTNGDEGKPRNNPASCGSSKKVYYVMHTPAEATQV